MNYTLDPEAFVELDAAVDYHERQEPGLGWRLAEAVDAAIQLLCEQPEAGRLVSAGLRHWVVRGFPYVLLYSIRPDEIYVEAVRHGRRAPRSR